jgi:hypothetical protein
MSDHQADATSGKRRIRTAAKPADHKRVRADGRCAATLLLPESVDFRLTSIAKNQKLDRSVLAAQLIDAGLRRFALDAVLRQYLGGEAGSEPDGAGG